MSLTLADEELQTIANDLAQYLTDMLLKDEIIPERIFLEVDEKFGIFQGALKRSAYSAWNKVNNQLSEQKQREIRSPVRLVKLPDKFTPEEKLQLFLPEEKIIFNQKIFRSILDHVSFDSLNPSAEKQLMGRLKTEAIGLNEQEILIYYNLIKWSKKPQGGSSADQANEAEDESENAHVYAAEVVSNIEQNIIGMDKIIQQNENRNLNVDFISVVFLNKIELQRASLKVYRLLTGSYEENKIFLNIMKTYLKMVSDNWGVDYEETMSYFCVFMLFSGADPKFIHAEQFSRTFQKFLLSDAGRIKSVIIANIKFIYLFLTILTAQVIEINKKFAACSNDQKEKLIKLYASQERQGMIVANASNFALRKLECAKSDLFDVKKNIKTFLSKFPNILNTEVLFKVKY